MFLLKLVIDFFETLLKNRNNVMAINRRVVCVIVYGALKMKSLTVFIGERGRVFWIFGYKFIIGELK